MPNGSYPASRFFQNYQSPWPTDMNLPNPIGKKVEERRATSRYKLVLLVEIRVAPNMAAVGTVLAETQDMSTQGFYFNIAQEFTVGTQFDFSITFPTDIIGVNQMNISGKARAVRVEETWRKSVGRWRHH